MVYSVVTFNLYSMKMRNSGKTEYSRFFVPFLPFCPLSQYLNMFKCEAPRYIEHFFNENLCNGSSTKNIENGSYFKFVFFLFHLKIKSKELDVCLLQLEPSSVITFKIHKLFFEVIEIHELYLHGKKLGIMLFI